MHNLDEVREKFIEALLPLFIDAAVKLLRFGFLLLQKRLNVRHLDVVIVGIEVSIEVVVLLEAEFEFSAKILFLGGTVLVLHASAVVRSERPFG